MDMLGKFEDGKLVHPESNKNSKTELAQEDGCAEKNRNWILGLLMKVFFPKSITTTPPPDRQIYY
ncbi:conserved hypothetical protein [delta proteobacterium NaphS2]|nr:conserved hypothetical protein [delta proteobacterium NaphS2]